jgi:hypothetical protein
MNASEPARTPPLEQGDLDGGGLKQGQPRSDNGERKSVAQGDDDARRRTMPRKGWNIALDGEVQKP